MTTVARSRAAAGLVRHLVPEGLEVGDLVGVDGELRAARHEVVDLGALGGHRRALVEGDLVDAEVLAEVGEEADQRLSDRARADDVDDLLHRCSPVSRRRLAATARTAGKDTMRREIRQPEEDRGGQASLRHFRGPAGASRASGRRPSGRAGARRSSRTRIRCTAARSTTRSSTARRRPWHGRGSGHAAVQLPRAWDSRRAATTRAAARSTTSARRWTRPSARPAGRSSREASRSERPSALKASAGDPRVAAFVALGAAAARPSRGEWCPARGAGALRRRGERHASALRRTSRFLAGRHRIVVIPGRRPLLRGAAGCPRRGDRGVPAIAPAVPRVRRSEARRERAGRAAFGGGARGIFCAWRARSARGALPRASPRRGSRRTARRAFGEARGLFVTLHRRGQLRGCIGTLAPHGDLTRGSSPSTRCGRPSRTRGFRRSTPASCPSADIEISVLTAPRRSRSPRTSRSGATA